MLPSNSEKISLSPINDVYSMMMAALQVNVHSYLFVKCILKPPFFQFWKAFPILDVRVKKGKTLSLYPY